MSTLMIKQSNTSEKVAKPTMSSMKSQSTMSPPVSSGHRSSDSEVEVVTLPKPRTKKIVKTKGSGPTKSKKLQDDPTAEAVIAMGGQVIGAKLPVIGPPVLFDESQLRVAFSLLDVNGDGMINCDELMSMLNKLGLKDFIDEKIVRSLIRDATKDVNPEGDILITEEQFVKWMPRLGMTGESSAGDIGCSSSSSASSSLSNNPCDQGQYSVARKESNPALRKGSLASQSSSSSYQSASSRTSLDRKSVSSPSSDRRTSNGTMVSSSSRSSSVASVASVPSPSRSSSIADTSGDNSDDRKKSLQEDDAEKDLRAAFGVFDQDHNGFITRDELISAMSFLGENLTETDIDNLIMKADTDKDGQINYEEFLQALM